MSSGGRGEDWVAESAAGVGTAVSGETEGRREKESVWRRERMGISGGGYEGVWVGRRWGRKKEVVVMEVGRLRGGRR